MEIQKYIDDMQKIQNNLLDFLDNEANLEENLHNLITIIDDLKLCDDQFKFKSFLHLLVKISNKHQHKTNFFSKIEQILNHFKKNITTFFSNHEIFKIFGSNKRILLFLIEEKIMTVDKFIIQRITSKKYFEASYRQFFQPEIKSFLSCKWFVKLYGNTVWFNELDNELPENFCQLRKIGENKDPICELIRKDLLKEFIIYVSKNNISLDSNINPSIYETNPLLYKQHNIDKYYLFFYKPKEISLIEYAAFCGSNQIFNYLEVNGVSLLSSLWSYSIHGQNIEIIHTLEDNEILPYDKTYKKCFYESIASHHNDIANYLINNHLNNDQDNSRDTHIQCLKYYNFAFMQNNLINKSCFYDLCRFDYAPLIEIGLKEWDIDINERIYTLIFNYI